MFRVSPQAASTFRVCSESGSIETIILSTGHFGASFSSAGMWSGVAKTMESSEWLRLESGPSVTTRAREQARMGGSTHMNSIVPFVQRERKEAPQLQSKGSRTLYTHLQSPFPTYHTS